MSKLKSENPIECGRLIADAARHGDTLSALYADPLAYLEDAHIRRMNGSVLEADDHIVPVVDGCKVTVVVVPCRQDIEDKLAEIDSLDLPDQEKEDARKRLYHDIGTYLFRRCD